MSAGHDPAVGHNRIYVVVWALLVTLTLITVGVSYLDMKKFVVFTAMVIATTKSLLVLLFFMHLKDEPRVIWIMVSVALGFFAIFMFLTFSDLYYRYL